MEINTYIYLRTKSNKNDAMKTVMGIYIIHVTEIYPVAQHCLIMGTSLF